MRARVVAFLSVAVLLVTGVAFAHHGAASYDMEKKVTIKGTVTDFQFINPHVLIGVESETQAGPFRSGRVNLPARIALQERGGPSLPSKLGTRSRWSGRQPKAEPQTSGSAK